MIKLSRAGLANMGGNGMNKSMQGQETINFREVTAIKDARIVSQLAHKIWRQHYIPIIGSLQVDYMLQHFQSDLAIQNQIASGYNYFLLETGGFAVAYFAMLPEAEQTLHISKIYVDRLRQRSGLGSMIITFIEAYCRKNQLEEIWLTVNRHNHGAINFYRKHGFKMLETLIQDIGNGFVMDDYKMWKKVR
jgi:diamine N-acetyltransferase